MSSQLPPSPFPPEALKQALAGAQQPMMLPDGGADVPLSPEGPGGEDQASFDANLAEYIPEHVLQMLAHDLHEKLRQDQKARELRDKQYEEGLRRSGLGGESPGGAEFDGASRATHPMLAEASVDFSAMAMRELFPPDGPVRAKVFGKQEDAKLELAERQSRFLNWQLTAHIPEYVEELEQLTTQLGMGGSQFFKFWRSADLGRPTCEFVPVDDMLLPYAAASFMTAQRRTHVQRLTQAELDQRVESGFYRDLKLLAPMGGMQPERTKAGKASDKIEGREPTGMNLDGQLIVYEVDTYLRLDIDKEERRPYLFSFDELSGRCLSVYRNWNEKDPRTQRLEWIVDYGFIPWRGAYKIGFPQLIGGLSTAATGALRALLDSAHINNAATGLKLKGSKLTGQNTQPEIGSVAELEGPPTTDDIRKLVMPMPFNPPSPVLFQLLGWLTDAAKGVVTTAEEKIADASNQMPVGTTLALIEQGGKVMSTIHSRLHRSQARVLGILRRLNAEDDQLEAVQKMELGEVIATQRDFMQPLAVMPVSDPNIFSDAQRYAQNQALLQLATSDPEVKYDKLQVHKRLLATMRIPQPEQVLPEPKKPQPMNAAVENSALMMGQVPLNAFPQQDHLAHLETHLRFIGDQPMAQLFMVDPLRLNGMYDHLRQHIALFYGKLMEMTLGAAMKVDPAQLEQAVAQNPALGVQLDQAIGAASGKVQALLTSHLEPTIPVLAWLHGELEKVKPPTPKDPTAVAQEDVQRRAAEGVAKEERERMALGSNTKTKVADLAIKRADLQRKRDKDNLDFEIDRQREENERLKFAAQLVEDSQAGNQISGV